MSSERLTERDGAVLHVTFNRPDHRNAMTFAMYDGVVAACEQVEDDDSIRAMVLRGAGDKAFVAGTDISQFIVFQSGADGVAYEERISEVVDRLEALRVPTIAAIRGYCVGGGLILAAACDLRIATPDSRFGVPVAKTLGNCLSMNSYSLLVHHLGPARTMDLLLRARFLTGQEAHAAGFVAELCHDDEVDDVVDDTIRTILGHAPLTMWATKQAIRRLRKAQVPPGDDLVETVFGSQDFRAGVVAFGEKRSVSWTGR